MMVGGFSGETHPSKPLRAFLILLGEAELSLIVHVVPKPTRSIEMDTF